MEAFLRVFNINLNCFDWGRSDDSGPPTPIPERPLTPREKEPPASCPELAGAPGLPAESPSAAPAPAELPHSASLARSSSFPVARPHHEEEKDRVRPGSGSSGGASFPVLALTEEPPAPPAAPAAPAAAKAAPGATLAAPPASAPRLSPVPEEAAGGGHAEAHPRFRARVVSCPGEPEAVAAAAAAAAGPGEAATPKGEGEAPGSPAGVARKERRPSSIASLAAAQKSSFHFASRASKAPEAGKPPGEERMKRLIDVVMAAIPKAMAEGAGDDEAAIAALVSNIKTSVLEARGAEEQRPSSRVKKDAQVVLKRIEEKRLEHKVHCAQIAPAVFVSIAEEFGLAPGTLKPSQLVQALKRIGFDHVFDLRYAADVTIMEEGSELLARLKSGGPFPMFTSCCAGWLRSAEEEYPDLLKHLSSCKSPMTMNTSLIKSFFAKSIEADPATVVVTSIMPCTIKKVEAQRPQLLEAVHHTDHVITTRELAAIFRAMDLNWDDLDGAGPSSEFSSWMGPGSGAGGIFGVTGGVMEAALRTAYELATGKPLENVKIEEPRGLFGLKEGALEVAGVGELKFCVVDGLTNIKRVMEQTRAGECPYHFVEIMMCTNGCISGPGQPRSKDKSIAKQRMNALYTADERAVIRKSHENPAVKRLYDEFLGQPLSHLSHELLHVEHWPHHKRPEGAANGHGHGAEGMDKHQLQASFGALEKGLEAGAAAAEPEVVYGEGEAPEPVAWALPPPAARVVYGSETGNAETLARVVAKELAGRGVAVKCSEADELEMDELQGVTTLLLVVSTAGQGELPDNCKDFYSGLNPSKHPKNWLRNLHYSVMGIGDSSYAFFNRAAVMFDERLALLGAQRFRDRGVGDDQDEERFETGFEKWAPAVYKALKLPPMKEDSTVGPPSHKVILTTGPNVTRKFEEGWRPILADGSAQLIRLDSNVRITPEGYDRDIRHLTFEVRDVPEQLKYTVGDALAIFPRNDPGETAAFLKWFGLEPTDLVSFKVNENYKGDAKPRPPLPPGTTLLDYVCDCVDLFGRPNARFFAALAKFATDVHQREELLAMAAKSWRGTAAFAVLQKDVGQVTYASLMSSYPSARPSLAQLLDLIPPIKPRYYSIASSPHVVPGKLELSVVIVDWEKPDKSVGYGTCTGYLRQLVDGPHWVPVALKPGVGICMPPHPSTPIVMAGLGTGLAPMRAMVQERWWQVVHGKRVGPSVLFFGCRHSKGDYLYSSKWDEYVQQGALSHLRVAFSRDGPKKVYIQDKIAAEPELLYDCFVKRGGYFFFCGPAGRVPQDIRAAIETAMSEAGKEEGFTKEMASQYIDKMRLQGRYIIEAWS
eukprot:tig00001095_g7031.t1